MNRTYLASGIHSLAIVFLTLIAGASSLRAQSAPPSSSQVWHSNSEKSLSREAIPQSKASYDIDPTKTYTLAELIDLAQSHNPETRAAWEAAKARAASLGVARGALFPTIAAVALAGTLRDAALVGQYFNRQTIGVFEPVLHVEYLVFDVGGRSGAIDEAKANLLASDLAFNDTHRKIIFAVAAAYYNLLNAQGQREAAEVSLKNAQTVAEDAQNRLDNGLATKPDQLEASAAEAQANYDLQAAIGSEDIARGNLATAMGLAPDTRIQVQPISELPLPDAMVDSTDQAIDRGHNSHDEAGHEDSDADREPGCHSVVHASMRLASVNLIITVLADKQTCCEEPRRCGLKSALWILQGFFALMNKGQIDE